MQLESEIASKQSKTIFYFFFELLGSQPLGVRSKRRENGMELTKTVSKVR
jgi:hypothetical protein